MNHERSSLVTSTSDERSSNIGTSLNPFRVQRGTFVTLPSASECRRILLRHTVLGSKMRNQFGSQTATPNDPMFLGYATKSKVVLRAPRRWLRGTVPQLSCTIREMPDGTMIDAELRVPMFDALFPSAVPSAAMLLTIISGKFADLPIVALVATLYTALSSYLLWRHRNAWDDYAWFLETFLSAKLVSYESRPV